jgi:hypothetical protein
MYYDRYVVQLLHPFIRGSGVENAGPADTVINVSGIDDSAIFEMVVKLRSSTTSSVAYHDSDDLGRTEGGKC